MRRSHLIQVGLFVALGMGALTACGDGEAVSSARVKVGTSTTAPTSSQPTSTTAPPVEAAAPKPAGPAPANTPPTSTKTSSPAATPVSTVDQVKLTVATNPKLGKIVVDGKGITIYRLDADNVKPVRSTCVDDCAKRFPPLLVPAGTTVTVAGLDPKLLGQLTRPDKTIQVTFAGRPLYHFVGDVTAGDTLGQGIAGGRVVPPA